MKRKKLLIVILIVVILVLAGILAVFIFMKQKNGNIETIISEQGKGNSESAFELYMKDIINSEYDNDFKCISLDGQISNELTSGDISSAITSKITYKVTNVEEGDEYSIVTAEFEYPNVIEICEKISNENDDISDQEINSKILEKLNSNDFSIANSTAQIALIYLDGDWYLMQSEQFNNIITGGIYSEYAKQIEEIYNQFR